MRCLSPRSPRNTRGGKINRSPFSALGAQFVGAAAQTQARTSRPGRPLGGGCALGPSPPLPSHPGPWAALATRNGAEGRAQSCSSCRPHDPGRRERRTKAGRRGWGGRRRAGRQGSCRFLPGPSRGLSHGRRPGRSEGWGRAPGSRGCRPSRVGGAGTEGQGRRRKRSPRGWRELGPPLLAPPRAPIPLPIVL